jgi:GT2 family glycosyltransferase
MTGSLLEGAANAEVAVVIVNYATPELTMRAVAALAGERNALPNLKAVVVDGGSPDNSTALLTQQLDADEYRDWLTFIPLSLNGGFGWANNQAILELARRDRPPEFIHFLNPDTEVNGRAVVALVEELLAHPKCGAAGSLLLNADNSVAASAFRFPTAGCELVRGAQSEKLGRLLGIPPAVVNSAQSIEVDWVTGASFMVRAAALQESGLFDDGFFLYFEEVELMHRLRLRGWSVRHVPDSRVMHLEGAATGLGATDSERPHPSYWYRSRRRYFGLTGGWTAILGLAIAALAGQTILGLKQLAGRTPGSKSVRTRDLVSLGLWPTAADVRSSVPKWGDLPGRPPAWMKP